MTIVGTLLPQHLLALDPTTSTKTTEGVPRWEQFVDVVVRSLRKKLGDQAAMIETAHGTGYRLRRS
jgi:DNA-binding response OmpR family regulator